MNNTISRFDSKTIKNNLSPVVFDAIQRAIEPFGLKVKSGGGKFSDCEWTGKFIVETQNKIDVLRNKISGRKISVEDVRSGFAPIGTVVNLKYVRNTNPDEHYTIVKIKRINYVIENSNGVQFNVKFRACHPVENIN
jgi:hypothetical protein